ncbi:MAG TPA: helix-turn-helix domain-containing protein [Nitrososphaeraceae archaeon]|nr:helix-turn-helix domain-containing protein [Nitrososphaeraceae archaeon]
MTHNLKFCPIHNTFNLIGKKFTILILRDMMLYGKKRFNELRESVEDINSKTLTLRLREMELDGLIVRRVYPETPVRIEYELTEKAKNLKPILEQLGEYSTRYCASNIFRDKRPRRFKEVLEEISVSNL